MRQAEATTYVRAVRAALPFTVAVVLSVAACAPAPQSADAGTPGTDGLPPDPRVTLRASPTLIDFQDISVVESFDLRRDGSGSVDFNATTSAAWLTLSRDRGTCGDAPVRIDVRASRSGLAPGEHTAAVVVAGSNGDELQIEARLNVLDSSGSAPDGGSGGSSGGDAAPDGDDGGDGGDDEAPPASYWISGQVREDGVGLSGVVVTADSGGTTNTTGADGYYEVEVAEGWSGTLTARHMDYCLAPAFHLVTKMLADRGGVDFAGAPAVDLRPNFRIVTSAGSGRTYYTVSQTVFDDQFVTAEVTSVGNCRWQLQITPKQQLSEILFPYEPEPELLNADSSDDVFLATRLMGTAIKADLVSEDTWAGLVYPGNAFSPFVVLADGSDARMLAATNWPPMTVRVAYRRDTLVVIYSDLDHGVFASGQTYTFGALAVWTKNDSTQGVAPWQAAVAHYKIWLREAMRAEGFYPLDYPDWLRQSHGWIHVNLHWMQEFNPTYIESRWDSWKSFLPWIQCWGQMSDYQDPNNPNTGCCVERIEVHDRYLPELLSVAANVAGDGGRFGYYSRPPWPYGPIDGSTAQSEDDLAFLLDWIDANTNDYGGNAWYLDVLGARYFGNPYIIAGYFETHFPAGAVIEWPVDVYPTAFLISGTLTGSASEQHHYGPGITDHLDALSVDRTRITFPRLGRYVLDQNAVFLGESNHDGMFWGSAEDYWTERQAFLLGAKFDAIRVSETPDNIDVIDRAIELCIAERVRVGWWDREPAYCDRTGITSAPSGIDIRRFVDRDGVNLFVLDNWNELQGQSFVFDGESVSIPVEQLSIVERP